MEDEAVVEEVPNAGPPVPTSQGSEFVYDPELGAAFINETTIPNSDVFQAVSEQHPELAALSRWGSRVSNPGRGGGILERDRYVTPETIFDQFKVALDASESDDVVSNFVETTEALAFNKVTMDADDPQQEDIWNQIAEGINIDARLREMWKETVTVSQFYYAVLWGNRNFKVRGKTKEGNQSRKEFKNLRVPIAITVLDPLKVVPVGNFMFGNEKLVYIANNKEADGIDDVLAGKNTTDLTVRQLMKGKYEASREELKFLKDLTGAKVDRLFELNPDAVFRHTATKPDYQRFAAVRMKSVFELLDLKQQLRQMDRSYLLGGTNFIMLVKKGSDKLPAKQSEVTSLANQVKATARVPVIIGDHRISVEIVTPKMDLTLKPERYNVLDARITSRLYQVFMTGNYAAGTKGDDSLKLSRVIARGMESRRHMIRQSLMENVFKPCQEANEDQLKDVPRMNFNPKRIALDFDSTIATFMQDLRDRGDISRGTILSEMDLNQDEEARKREREKENGYDKLFEPTNTIPGAMGRRMGGNQSGGGANKDSFRANPQNDNRAQPGSNEDDKARADLEELAARFSDFVEKTDKVIAGLEIDVVEHTEKLAELDYDDPTADNS